MSTTSRDHAKSVSKRFLKAMKQVIARELQGVRTKTAFAEMVGEHQQNISRMEKGERYVTIDSVVNTCIQFGISPAWILLEQGEMFANEQKKQKRAQPDLLSRMNEATNAIAELQGILGEVQKLSNSTRDELTKPKRKAS